jgi:hypothetical protein
MGWCPVSGGVTDHTSRGYLMGCQGVYLYRSLARLLTVRRLLAQRSAYARPWAVRTPPCQIRQLPLDCHCGSGGEQPVSKGWVAYLRGPVLSCCRTPVHTPSLPVTYAVRIQHAFYRAKCLTSTEGHLYWEATYTGIQQTLLRRYLAGSCIT